MSGYAVDFTTAAARMVRRLDPPIRRRILAGIAGLAADPRPDGVRKLSGAENAWRIRISAYRVIYEIHDNALEVLVVEAGHRREVCR
ncbi:type II toxin-antitoxin system RelE family toxin [Rudaeicoccus suwonensis]|uniref:mRNA interferase RelE/StbE n=1 Tax=Rudaeicoccus suwonensis TaxID=657409 RepID=A0A561E847_9MICO|nr:type II toxin-antitoxin system RelE/ParE family toxin [Rudaeicoccus suwonensis]TWE11777.1 mRNA interferase RelE/StbE [Rudaeicoccus suwonensis]